MWQWSCHTITRKHFRISYFWTGFRWNPTGHTSNDAIGQNLLCGSLWLGAAQAQGCTHLARILRPSGEKAGQLLDLARTCLIPSKQTTYMKSPPPCDLCVDPHQHNGDGWSFWRASTHQDAGQIVNSQWHVLVHVMQTEGFGIILREGLAQGYKGVFHELLGVEHSIWLRFELLRLSLRQMNHQFISNLTR